MTERQAYLAFHLTSHVGSATLARLVEKHGSAVAAWESYPNKVARAGDAVDVEAEEARARSRGVQILTLLDEGYPARLKAAPQPPLALYVKGDVAALGKPFVALVGTRRATAYGQEMARRLARDLAQAGWGIVSGLAVGIDGESHRGALDANGLTVGVIGSALDKFYPEENLDLAREIVEKGGAVVSQFPFGHPADQTTFPIRNHVVAALSSGVVAVECPLRSGTLITTSMAADLGRPVMAVPGRVDQRMSAGCLHLIREGATLVRHADDVLEILSDFFGGVKRPPRKEGEKEEDAEAEEAIQTPPRYSVEEALLMTHIDREGISLDELVRRTRLPVAKVNSLVMELRIKGFVRFLPGNRVSLL